MTSIFTRSLSSGALGYLAVALREGAEQSWFAASVRVHVGDQVRAGDALGKLGSSGNSTEPHLLFRVCDKPDPLMCAGIPLNFSNVTVQWAGLPHPLQRRDVVLAK